MIILVQIDRNPIETWSGYFQVENTDTLFLKGSVFKTYDMKTHQDGGWFVISFQHATDQYPRIRLTNRVHWLSQSESDHMIIVEPGTPLLEAIAHKLLGEGSE